MEPRKLSWEHYRNARSIPGLTAQSAAKIILAARGLYSLERIPDFRKERKPESDKMPPLDAHKYSIILTRLAPDGTVSQEFKSDSKVIKIGRVPDSHIFIDDATVSRLHAVLEITDGYCQIIDLGSTHGTFVNGEQVRNAVLKVGDIIKFGDVPFKVTQINHGDASISEPVFVLPSAAPLAPVGLSKIRVSIVLSEVGSDDSLGREYAASAKFCETNEFLGGQSVIKIGKLATSHICIDSETVSRMHAYIEMREGCCQIIDLGSTHGTFVNGKRIGRSDLKEGDTIALGSVPLKVMKITYEAVPTPAIHLPEGLIRGPGLEFLFPEEPSDRSPPEDWGATMEGALSKANVEHRVIASNKRLQQAVRCDEWKLITIKNHVSWTGTMTAYEEPGKPFGRFVEYTDDQTGISYVFPVPEKFVGVKNGLLVVEHPDFTLETKESTRIVRAARIELIEKFPAEEGWYIMDPNHGISFGDKVDAFNPDAGYLCRRARRAYKNKKVGLIGFHDLCPEDNHDSALVTFKFEPSQRLGLAVESVSKTTKK